MSGVMDTIKRHWRSKHNSVTGFSPFVSNLFRQERVQTLSFGSSLRMIKNSSLRTPHEFFKPTIEVAKMYPDPYIEHLTGLDCKYHASISSYSARFYEGRYVIGEIAGAMTRLNLVADIADYQIRKSCVTSMRSIQDFTVCTRMSKSR